MRENKLKQRASRALIDTITNCAYDSLNWKLCNVGEPL